ncbi:MAG TPA: MauE/DoxX family redox-associated membrane protein [Kiritimatiellia bacterium]|nr:MauE/DoxX family redox-associated membrane protein [Kiritimatiellia bacterium]
MKVQASSRLLKELIPHVLRLLLGGVFIYAAWPKIVNPEAFAQLIYHYKLVPDALINPMALILPWLELVCGVFLIVAPRFRQGAAILIIAMLIVFTFAVGINVVLGREITCGCFSVAEDAETIGWRKVFENLALIGVGIYCARIATRHPSLTEAT